MADPKEATFRARSEMSSVFNDMKRLRSEAGRLRSDFQGASAGIADSLDSMGRNMQRTGSMMTLGVTLPIVAGFRSIFRTFDEFDQEATRTGLIMDATTEQAEALRAKAIELGASFGRFSPQDAIEGMQELTAAGLDFEKTMAAIEPTLQLAEVANLDVASAAELAAGTMNAFGLEASDLAHVNDVLATTMNVSAFQGEELAEALAHAGQLGATANQDLESVASALALIRNQGIPAASAGTALRQALDNLKAPLKKARTLMENLGIVVRDANGDMLQLPDIVESVGAALSEENPAFVEWANSLGLSGQAAKDMALDTLFGVEAMKGMGLLMNSTLDITNDLGEGTALLAAIYSEDFVKGLEEGQVVTVESSAAMRALDNQMRNSDGTAAHFAAQMNETFGASVRNAGGAIESLAIAIATVLAPSVTSFIQESLIPFIERMTEWVTANPEAVKTIAKIAAALAVLGPMLIGIGGALRAVSFAIKGFGAAGFAKMLGPWGLFIGLIAAVIATSPELIDLLMELAMTLGEALTPIIEALMPVFTQLVEALVPIIVQLVEAFVPLIEALLPSLIPLLEALVPIIQIVADVLTFLIGLLVPVVEFFAAIQGGLFEIIGAFLSGDFQAIPEIVDRVFGGAFEKIKGVVGAVVGFISGFVAWLKGFWQDAWNVVSKIVSVVWNVVRTVVQTAISGVASVITNVMNGIKSFWEGVWNFFKGIVEAAMRFLQGDIVGAFKAIKGAFDGFFAKLGEAANFVKAAVDKIIGFFTNLRDRAKGILDAVGGFLSKLNPFARHSPSLVDQVDAGVDFIAKKYGELSDLEINTPTVTFSTELDEGASGLPRTVFLEGLSEELNPLPVTVSGSFEEGITDSLDVMSGTIASSGVETASAVADLDSSVTGTIESEEATTRDVLYELDDTMTAVRDSINMTNAREGTPAPPLSPGPFKPNLPSAQDIEIMRDLIEKGLIPPQSLSELPLVKPSDVSFTDLPFTTAVGSGGDTFIVNNPAAVETEESLREIAMLRTYLGANGTAGTAAGTSNPNTTPTIL